MRQRKAHRRACHLQLAGPGKNTDPADLVVPQKELAPLETRAIDDLVSVGIVAMYQRMQPLTAACHLAMRRWFDPTPLPQEWIRRQADSTWTRAALVQT